MLFKTSLPCLFLLGALCLGQLPPAQKLSPADFKEFTQELYRWIDLIPAANDTCSIEDQIARTYAAGGQYREAIEWLGKTATLNCGFDPSRDPLFSPLASSKEFQALNESVRASTPAVRNSYAVTTIAETNLFPENMAYDVATSTFLIGSTSKDEIVRCHSHSPCEPFVSPRQDGLGDVFGLKLDPTSQTLWATSNTASGASLRQYKLASGALIGNYSLSGSHLFNDLVVSSHGDLFVTDTKQAAVYKLSNQNKQLRRFAFQHEFTAANGIALSSDEKKLFVSNFGDGITVVDAATEATAPLSHPREICLGYIDGLYTQAASLIAIQNGPMTPRIVRLFLDRTQRHITAMTILERRNPLFDGLTTGTLVSGQVYYIANAQIDKKDTPNVKLNPLHILAIKLN